MQFGDLIKTADIKLKPKMETTVMRTGGTFYIMVPALLRWELAGKGLPVRARIDNINTEKKSFRVTLEMI